MKQSLNPSGFSAKAKRFLKKRRALSSEIVDAWYREIPREARSSIPWVVMSSMVADLGSLVPSSVSDALAGALLERSVKGLLDITQLASPQLYGDARSYIAASCVLNSFKKYPWVGEGIDPERTAKLRLEQAELSCRLTNKRLIHYRQFDFGSQRPLTGALRVHEVFHLARRKINQWLGPVTPAVFSLTRHGPGGCVGLKRPVTTPYYKFGVGDYTVSSGAYWHALRSLVGNDQWIKALSIDAGLCDWDHNVSCVPLESRVKLVDARCQVANYNEVTFVPKDAKTHRSIAIEPRLNVWLQLSVGAFLKEKLRAAGVDLRDQERNRELAYVGSVQGEPEDPVTIDLEMASDTLSIELVRELLPPEWFELLDSLRSHDGLYEGKVRRWAKFSSMGNGFTFELETLIFYALAQAVSDLSGTTSWFKDTFGPRFKYAYVSVYGDDIIVPQRMSAQLISVLRFCGFRTNRAKTYLAGPFRESCGKDFYAGRQTRAMYFDRELVTSADLIGLHNQIKSMEARLGLDFSFTREVLLEMLPQVLVKHLRGWNPTEADGYLWFDPDACHVSKLVHWDVDLQSWFYPIVRRTPEVFRGRLHWRYVQFLYAQTDRTVRDHIDSTVVRRGYEALHEHLSQGGSAGDVVRSGTTRGVLSLAH